MQKLLVAFALGAAVAEAACPGGCSGHGTCGAADVCACQQNWAGGDCSLRACPFGPSWAATTMDTLTDDRLGEEVVARTPGGYFSVDVNGAYEFPETFAELYPKTPATHAYIECSGRGTCDYSTGLCRCFEGYDGRGCRRTTCPAGCSGHGRCLTNAEVNPAYTSLTGPNDQYWDAHRTQSCVCDRGFSGYDCSQRICPFGDDPTTACSENSAADYQLVQVAVTDNSTFFTLEFTDMFGGAFTTRPIAVDNCNPSEGCRELQYALMELPNFAIPEVEVDLVSVVNEDVGPSPAVPTTVYSYVVHFSDPSNTGKQNTLQCETIADSDDAGASPKYENVAACMTFNVGQPEWFSASGDELTLENTIAGVDMTYAMDDLIPDCTGAQCADTAYEEFVPCSNSGLCDYATGTCVCSEGHFGEACEKQSTFF